MENKHKMLVIPTIYPNINFLDLHGKDSTNNGTESDQNIRIIMSKY